MAIRSPGGCSSGTAVRLPKRVLVLEASTGGIDDTVASRGQGVPAGWIRNSWVRSSERRPSTERAGARRTATVSVGRAGRRRSSERIVIDRTGVVDRSTEPRRGVVPVSLARQMAAGLHFTIGGAGRTAVDDVAVVTEDTRELLGYVCPAVATACACSRRFHGLPILLCGFHGWDGGYSNETGWGREPPSSAGRRNRPVTVRTPVHRYSRPGITRIGGANPDKGRRLFTRLSFVRSAKYTVSGL